jgi:hypothetical protein
MKGLLNCRLPEPRFDQVLPCSIWMAPICEKPLLEYCLDLFLYLGIKEIIIVDYLENAGISARFGTGSAWGVQISYEQGQTGEVLAEILERLQPSLTDDFLIIDGPLFPFFDRNQLKPLTMPQREAIYSLNQRHLNLTDNILLVPHSMLLKLLAGNRFENWVQVSLDHHPDIRFPVVPLNNLTAYLQVNLEVMARGERFELPAVAEQPALWKGRHLQISPSAQLTVPLWLGSDSQIGSDCEVQNSLLSGQVRLENNAQLDECLVLGPSYIAQQQLQRKIILGQKCLHPATGLVEDLSPHWAWQKLLNDPQALAEKRQRERVWVEAFLRWRRPLFHWFKRFARATEQHFYLDAQGQELVIDVFRKRKIPALPERLFFQWELEKVPFFEAVLAEQLWLVGNRLLPKDGFASSWISRLPIYAPGVFSYAELKISERNQWLSELHYCSAYSEDLDNWILEQSLREAFAHKA